MLTCHRSICRIVLRLSFFRRFDTMKRKGLKKEKVNTQEQEKFINYVAKMSPYLFYFQSLQILNTPKLGFPHPAPFINTCFPVSLSNYLIMPLNGIGKLFKHSLAYSTDTHRYPQIYHAMSPKCRQTSTLKHKNIFINSRLVWAKVTRIYFRVRKYCEELSIKSECIGFIFRDWRVLFRTRKSGNENGCLLRE